MSLLLSVSPWCFLALPQSGAAREVLFDGARSIEIRPALSDETRHRTCVVSFPEESIETLVVAWNDGDLSLERKRGHLFIKLLRPAEGDLHVLGAGGTLYRLRLKPAEGSAADEQVRIVLPSALAARTPDAIALVRAMRLSRPPESANVRRLPYEILSRIGSVEARGRWAYETTHHTGHVVELLNTGSEPFHVDPRRFSGPDLLLVGVREPVLPPGGRTQLYFVFWR